MGQAPCLQALFPLYAVVYTRWQNFSFSEKVKIYSLLQRNLFYKQGVLLFVFLISYMKNISDQVTVLQKIQNRNC